MTIFGELVHIFGELVHIWGELVNSCGKLVHIFAWKLVSRTWRVPNPPGANPLVAERAPWGGLRSLVWQGVSSLLEIPTDSYHFLCAPSNPH